MFGTNEAAHTAIFAYGAHPVSPWNGGLERNAIR